MSKELKKMRGKIDRIDFEILKKLAERFSLVSKIAGYKAKNNLPIFNGKREREMVKARKVLAKKYKLDESVIERLFKLIIRASRSKQKNAH